MKITPIRDLADRYDVFLLDIWGVLHDGVVAYPYVVDCLERLNNAGKTIALISNSPSRSQSIASRLDELGIPRDLYGLLMSSGELCHELLAAGDVPGLSLPHGRQIRYYDLWPRPVVDMMRGLDQYRQVEKVQDADFITGTLTDGYSHVDVAAYHDLLGVALDRNLTMLCANPDKVVNIGSEIHLCPGSVADAYAEMGGQVVSIGKPHAGVYEALHLRLGSPDKARMIAVGDSLRTDVTGANGFGIDSAFNLVGIHWEDVHIAQQPDAGKIAALASAYEQTPTYAIHGLRW